MTKVPLLNYFWLDIKYTQTPTYRNSYKSVIIYQSKWCFGPYKLISIKYKHLIIRKIVIMEDVTIMLEKSLVTSEA